ncbi:MAG TPA: hypothetical protein VFR58_11760 [Flavisolibacter sp.]|nr:hypothetical protein [Flavisolibacter sp.]
MEKHQIDPRDPKQGRREETTLPDLTPRREGGDDALAESSPTDERSDEKVIVNEQRGNKTVNAPSQTSAGTNESNSYGEGLLD